MTPDELRAMTPEITLDEMTAIGREAGLVRAVGPKRNAWHGWEHELHTFAILVGVRERRALLAEVEALRANLDHAYERIDALANWAESHGCDVSYDRSLLAALKKTT